MIKYLGSKRLLLDAIVRAVTRGAGAHRAATVLDPFSGTARVGHALKGAGLRVLANDHNAYAHTLATCYVQADAERWQRDAERLVTELDALPGRAGWFTHTYCEQARYLHPRNGERVEAIREAIAAKGLEPELEAVLLTALLQAADRVDSTTGVQMAYLKTWAPRAHQRLTLRVPALLPRAAAGAGRASMMDALDFVRAHEGDVCYLDPPYNQHSYLGNYHLWETVVRWDQPETYGVARKRVDVRARTSRFNSKRAFAEALAELVRAVRAPTLVLSFSDEGFVTRAWMRALLAESRRVRVVSRDYKRYVGAQIGVYNPAGEKVGTPGKLRNTEFLFIATAR